MRTIRIILYAFGLLLTVLLALGFIADKDLTLSKSIYIDTPKNLVFEEVSILKKMMVWSPHVESDTTAKFTFEGTPGTIGSKVYWKGNRKVGSAEQVISEIEALRKVVTEIWYTRPYAHKRQFEYYLEDEGNGTKLTWEIKDRIPFPFNLMNLISAPDQKINRELETGLAALRDRCELNMRETEYKGFDINSGYALQKQYRVIRNVIPFPQRNTYIDSVFAILGANDSWKDSIQIIAPIVMFNSIDYRDSIYDMSVGFEVYNDSIQVRSRDYIMDSVSFWSLSLDIPGSTLDDAYTAMRNFIRYNGLKQESQFIETFATDDSTGTILSDKILGISYLIAAE